MYDRTKELYLGMIAVLAAVATYGGFIALSIFTSEDKVGSTVQDALLRPFSDGYSLYFMALPLLLFFISTYAYRTHPHSSLKQSVRIAILPVLALAFWTVVSVVPGTEQSGGVGPDIPEWFSIFFLFPFYNLSLMLIFLGLLAELRRMSSWLVLTILAAGALFLLWGAWGIVGMSNENVVLQKRIDALDAQVAQLRSADDESLDGILVNSASICDGFPNTGRSSYWTARCWSSVARQLTDETDFCAYSREEFSKAVCVQVQQDQGGY
jgi:threonine/homoserine/homoserine lactone efflux protein